MPAPSIALSKAATDRTAPMADDYNVFEAAIIADYGAHTAVVGELVLRGAAYLLSVSSVRRCSRKPEVEFWFAGKIQ